MINPVSHSPFVRRERGSALLTVLLFTFLLISLGASIMGWSLSERRLNMRNARWLEARNAAEAVAEYGCYQVAQAYSVRMNPTFSSGGNPGPITFPSTLASTFFPSGSVGTAFSHVDATSILLQAGAFTKVPATGSYYVDPADPNNTNDPLVGRWVNRRDVTVLGKATVNAPPGGGPPITAYIEEKVSIRGASLLAYAIFYSGNDLEVNPLPQMDIYGPVHVNGNLFVGSVSNGVTLNFHGPVTASGNVFHAWRGTTSTAQEGSTMSSTSAVQFATDSTGNTLVSMKSSAGVWNDSTMGADSSTNGLSSLNAFIDTTTGTAAQKAAAALRNTQFAQNASQTWHGNLQTAAMGIQSYNPMGFGEVVAHNSTTNTDILATDPTADQDSVVGTSYPTTDSSGYGHGYGPHSLIEPPTVVSSSDTYASAKQGIEENKFSNKAGLYVKVVVSSTGSLTGITLYGDPNSASAPPTGTPAGTATGPNGGIQLGTAPANVIQYVPYTSSGSGSSTNVTKGMYDQRQNVGVNLVQIDMKALKTALNDMVNTSTTTGTVGTDILGVDNSHKWGLGPAGAVVPYYDKYTPNSTGWNGGVYVDVESADTTHQTAVILANGYVANGSSLVPVVNGVGQNGAGGLTIATNAPAYVLGSFNSDGSIGATGTSNSALYPDDSASGTVITASAESPVAIAADTISILSPNYFGTSSGTNTAGNAPTTYNVPSTNGTTSSAYASYKTVKPTASSSVSSWTGVEVAAAFISGTTTTSPTSTGTQEYSGGVHNMPRFLESWSGKTVAIRGSLVSMYNARVATVSWGADYYDPPTRQWGFDQLFANGTFPPIIPQVISYRRVDFTYLANAAAYATEVSKL